MSNTSDATYARAILRLIFMLGLFGTGLFADLKAKVIHVQGYPKAIEGTKIRTLILGDEVKVGEKVITAEDEFLTLQLESGHKIFVLAATTAVLAQLKDGKVELSQQSGSIWSKIQPLGEEESFHIRTPSAVAGVRGTAFITMVLDPKTTSVCVCEGKVEVESGGKKSVVEGGFGAKLTKGAAPPAPMSNMGLIRNKRRLSRKKACMACHLSGGEYSSEGLDMGGSLIFQAKP